VFTAKLKQMAVYEDITQNIDFNYLFRNYKIEKEKITIAIDGFSTGKSTWQNNSRSI
jgi:hypothetical protein